MATTKATRKQTEITSAAIYRCTCKTTHEVFYMVASDSEAGVFYQVRFNHSAARWECQCPSAYPCKHVRAVSEVLAIRRTRIATEMGGSVPAVVAQMQAEEDKKLANAEVEKAVTFAALKTQYDVRQSVGAVSTRKERESASLNGNNRPFSMMR